MIDPNPARPAVWDHEDATTRSGSGRPLVVDLTAVDRTNTDLVGGKGAHLGELMRVEGVSVPAGFCVTTAAFRRAIEGSPAVDRLLDELSGLDPDDRDATAAMSAALRAAVEGAGVPDEVAAAIRGALDGLGTATPWAVRSSATAEDLPTASFAGQQDSYLGVVGADEVVRHVGRCWASLFTDRAVAYRQANGFDHRTVRMGVVVQAMVAPRASGVLFTADPVTSDRTVTSLESCLGLGEGLVAGFVEPDVHTVRDGRIVDRRVATKERKVVAAAGGGVVERPVDARHRQEPALTDAEVLRLVEVGRRIEDHFGCPQDIEWCLDDGALLIVQSRPITTLFPVPEREDDGHRVYVSVGHQQMMTDPMTPLGLSMWQLTAARPMYVAGSRLFVDVTEALASPASRAALLALSRSDPLTGDALEQIAARGFVPSREDDPAGLPARASASGSASASGQIEIDAAVAAELVRRGEEAVAETARAIGEVHGPEVFDVVLADVAALKELLFDPRNLRLIMAPIEAGWWLNEHLEEWLGERNAADTLTLSVPGNVTSEMGLALLDVADVVRAHPDVVTFLREVDDDGFLDRMDGLEGGPAARDAIRGYLERYGMRCVGEIDITRPRWSERPSTLVPLILSDVDAFEPGESARRFERGLQEAADKERELLDRLRALPGGDEKAAETERMIDRLRTFSGYREHPKYTMISRYFLYKQALLREARRLVEAGVLADEEDSFFLTFGELHDVARTGRVDQELIARRRRELRAHRSLTPPRVLTSDGEAVAGAYRRDGVPPGALVGIPVSSGTVEGRARVILDISEASDLGPGDVLVTAHTDPSWSPVFVTIAGLVTEVGGRTTHGAVVAREYGLPAVVGVEHATERIRDGQRIRVHGTDGHVELLD